MIRIATVALVAWIAMCVLVFAQSSGLMTFEEAKQRADSGDSFAQAVVALHYQLGWNTEKNPELAAKYALASANAKHPLGFFRLGALLREGIGVPKDEQRGLTLQAASFNGLYSSQDPYSMTAAGILIFQGKVVGQNVPVEQRYRDAAALYEKAADQGYAPAMFLYAMCAEAGHGVPKNKHVRDEKVFVAHQHGYPPATEVLDADAWGTSAERFKPECIKVEEGSYMPRFNIRKLAMQNPPDFKTGTVHPVFQMHPIDPKWVAFSKDDRLVAVVSSTQIFIYETASGRLLLSTEFNKDSLKNVRVNSVEHPPPNQPTSGQSVGPVFQRAYFDQKSQKLWVVSGADFGGEDFGDQVFLWDLNTCAFATAKLPVIGKVIGFDGNVGAFAVLEESGKKLQVVNPQDGAILESFKLPDRDQLHSTADEYLFSAIFGPRSSFMLVECSAFEGSFMGLERIIEISSGTVHQFPWHLWKLGKDGSDHSSVSREAANRLISFLKIPETAAVWRDDPRDPYKTNKILDIQCGDKAFNLDRSIALGSQVCQLITESPFVSWALLSQDSSARIGRVVTPTSLFAEGVSASMKGERILFWGIDNQRKVFAADGRIHPELEKFGAVVPERAAPATVFDLFSLDSRECTPVCGKQIWNTKLSDDGSQALLAVSDLDASANGIVKGSPFPGTFDGSIFPSTEVQVELHELSAKNDKAQPVAFGRIWPFGSYTEGNMYPDVALQETSLAFLESRYQTDYDRFVCDTNTLTSATNVHPYLFNDHKGWHRKQGAFSRTVTDRVGGVKTSWEAPELPVGDPQGLWTRLSAEDSSTGETAHCLIGGIIDAAVPAGNDLICFQTGQMLAMWNWRQNSIVSVWAQEFDVSNGFFSGLVPRGVDPVQQQLSISPEGKRILQRAVDGTIRVLTYTGDGKIDFIGTIVARANMHPVFVTGDYYYASRDEKSSGIHFSDGRRTYPFEQFDLRLNRPDIVLERLGAPPEAVGIAKQLREKRLKRMGVTEEMLKPDFHVPEIEIVGEVPATTDGSEINLTVKANDSKYPLERLKVYVNNVPVNGRDGELLREERKVDGGLLGRITNAFSGAPTGPQSLERAIPIKLAAGRNKIQVSVLNNAGAESLYANAEVNCTAKRPKPTLYAVAMGVSEYSNADWNLKYAAKDARDVLANLKAKAGDQYGEVKELLLTDKDVTKESLAKVREFLKGATIDDTVMMFAAGHGLLDSKYDYYFGTTDIDFNNPSDKGIAFEEFDDILADLPCLKKSLLVDTCHAGELDEEEKTLLASAGSGGAAPLPTGQGIAMRSIGTRGMNVKAIEGARGASEWYERLQGLFVDLRRGSGSTILTSAAGAEYALESSEQQNGLFTYAVLEALDGKKDADTDKDGSIEMSELGEYVKKRVAELTNNKQTPNTRRVNLEGDFTLAKTK